MDQSVEIAARRKIEIFNSMKKEDLKDMRIRHLQMENVRLNNEVEQSNAYALFLEEENRSIYEEARAESEAVFRLQIESLSDEVFGLRRRVAEKDVLLVSRPSLLGGRFSC